VTPIHLDTDIGGDPDDACALVMALGWDGADVVGITTNLEHEGKRAGCAAHYLRLARRSRIRVAAGTAESLSNGQRYESTWGDERYWPDPVKPLATVAEGALDLLERSIKRGATIVALGSFTNLAKLELRAPGALANVPVVAMAGWLEPPAPELPQWGPESDFNAQCDPRAVEVVAAVCDLTLVPLPTAMTVALRTRDLPRLRAAGPCGALLALQSETHAAVAEMHELANQNAGLPADIVNFHWDPVTCAAFLCSNATTTETRPLETRIDHGIVRFEPSPTGRMTKVAVTADGDAFAEQFATCVERLAQ